MKLLLIVISMCFNSNLFAQTLEQNKSNGDPALEVQSTNKPGTEIYIHTTPEKSILDIHCPFGIDRAVIERNAHHWPETIEIRLHLSGLESFTIRAGETTLRWNVLSTQQNVSCTLQEGNREEVVTSESAYYSDILIIDKKQNHSLKKRIYKLRVPSELLKDNPQVIRLEWIDFYRN